MLYFFAHPSTTFYVLYTQTHTHMYTPTRTHEHTHTNLNVEDGKKEPRGCATTFGTSFSFSYILHTQTHTYTHTNTQTYTRTHPHVLTPPTHTPERGKLEKGATWLNHDTFHILLLFFISFTHQHTHTHLRTHMHTPPRTHTPDRGRF